MYNGGTVRIEGFTELIFVLAVFRGTGMPEQNGFDSFEVKIDGVDGGQE
jgi:hypothetical protein